MSIVHLKAFCTPKIWIDCSGDLHNPNDSEDNWKADNESNIDLANSIDDTVTLGQRNVIELPDIPKSIWPIRRLQKQAERCS